MKTDQVNLRLEVDLIASLERAAEEEALDRSTMIRKLIHEGLARRRVDRALLRYQRREISIGRAVEESGLDHWQVIELARSRGIAYPLTPEEVDLRVGTLGRSPRVAETSTSGRRAKTLLSTETLPDRPPSPGGVLLVGINPAPISVRAGHYYQGSLGKRLWKRLQLVGLLADATPGREDDSFVEAGNGLTDVVKRPTRSASEVTRQELAAGAERLRARVREWRPALVLFPFQAAAHAALGERALSPGPCGSIGGVPAFLLSGPYAAKSITDRVDAELKAMLTRKRG